MEGREEEDGRGDKKKIRRMRKRKKKMRKRGQK